MNIKKIIITFLITLFSFSYAVAKDVKITVWAGGTNEADYYRMEAIKMAADILTREMAIQGEEINITEKVRETLVDGESLNKLLP